MYRLFIAIDLPEQVKEAVAAIAGDLPGAPGFPGNRSTLPCASSAKLTKGCSWQ